MKTVGEILRIAREKRGMSLDEISSATKIKRKFLEFIENNQYACFSSIVALEGFVKNYAQFLGVDVERSLLLLKRDYPAEKGKLVVREKDEDSFYWNPKYTAMIGVAIIAALFIGYFVWQYTNLAKAPYK
jgi:cytoskeletal protein RodZ